MRTAPLLPMTGKSFPAGFVAHPPESSGFFRHFATTAADRQEGNDDFLWKSSSAGYSLRTITTDRGQNRSDQESRLRMDSPFIAACRGSLPLGMTWAVINISVRRSA